jgi:hypothetical protein
MMDAKVQNNGQKAKGWKKKVHLRATIWLFLPSKG